MASIGQQIWDYRYDGPSTLPAGPSLTPTPQQLIDPDLLKFVWNNNNVDIFNAAKAPIAGELFGIKTEYVLAAGGIIALLALMGGRR